MNNLIALAGSGWGFWAAYSSLIRKFDIIELITPDEKAFSNIRPNDILLKHIKETKSKLLICAGYKPIISSHFLSSKDVINIHYSLLPKYRGMHSTVWAILNNEAYLGLSIHLMNENIDDGPILYQYKIKNNEFWTSSDFMKHFNEHVAMVLSEVIFDYINGRIIPQMQNKELATWVGRRNKHHCLIDFNQSFDYTQRFFRALVDPYPLPYFCLNGINYEVIEFDLIKVRTISEIGRIVNIEETGIYVSMPEGYILVKKALINGGVVKFSNFKIGNYLNH